MRWFPTKKTAVFFIIIMVLFASGCAKQSVDKISYTYQGENGVWSAEMKLNATVIWTTKDGFTDHKSTCDRVLTVTYKNDISELSSVKDFVLGYDSGISSSRQSGAFSEFPRVGNTFTFTDNGSNSAMEIKESVIVVQKTQQRGRNRTAVLYSVMRFRLAVQATTQYLICWEHYRLP